jgi:hypothetical protein
LHKDPPTPGDGSAADEDPIAVELYEAHERYLLAPPPGRLARLAGKKPVRPRFQHLTMHSDCEGFYLPRDFADVILDTADPQREGLGYMVGSSVRLLAECRELAEAIDLPPDIDPQADILWDHFEAPAADGPLWHRYGVEAFCLARLIRGSERSIETGGALVFC